MGQNVAYGWGYYQNDRESTATLSIFLTNVPDWIGRRFFPGGEVFYTIPPAYFRYRFTSPSGQIVYSNWVGINGPSFLILDPPESNGWSDDLEVVGEPGVTWDVVNTGRF